MAQAWIGLSWLFKHTCILLLPGPSALFLKQGQKIHRVPKELLGLKTQYQYACDLGTIQLCLSKEVISRWPDYLLSRLFPLQGFRLHPLINLHSYHTVDFQLICSCAPPARRAVATCTRGTSYGTWTILYPKQLLIWGKYHVLSFPSKPQIPFTYKSFSQHQELTC